MIRGVIMKRIKNIIRNTERKIKKVLKNIIKKVRNLENISTGLLTFLVYRTNMVVYNRFKALKI